MKPREQNYEAFYQECLLKLKNRGSVSGDFKLPDTIFILWFMEWAKSKGYAVHHITDHWVSVSINEECMLRHEYTR